MCGGYDTTANVDFSKLHGDETILPYCLYMFENTNFFESCASFISYRIHLTSLFLWKVKCIEVDIRERFRNISNLAAVFVQDLINVTSPLANLQEQVFTTALLELCIDFFEFLLR